jgi:colanic acid/amylovoran biosynthesis protein
MKILLENGSYPLHNFGDIAMLQVTIDRFRERWPEAHILVVTEEPKRLATYFPDVFPLNPMGRTELIKAGKLFGRFQRFLPGSGSAGLSTSEVQTWRRLPGLAESLLKLKTMRRNIDPDLAAIKAFLNAVFSADIVAASGGGYINDSFRHGALQQLETFGIANALGLPTAMFGQGIGPIQDAKLAAKVKAILPSVDLIAIREQRYGRTILSTIGVEPRKVITTGDDAIELAYEARSEALGSGIGVNMRIAKYSQIDDDAVEVVSYCVNRAADKLNAELIPLPISFAKGESDVRTLERLLAGNGRPNDGGRHLSRPTDVIRQTGRCRMVVTSSYHPAVFALAQGIPVVAVAKSEYYVNKFEGLYDQFGGSCDIIRSGEASFKDGLGAAIDNAWNSASHVKARLVNQAKRQYQASKGAYRHFFQIVDHRNQSPLIA